MNGTLNVRGDGSSYILNQAIIQCPINGICNIECLSDNACDYAKIYLSNDTILTMIGNASWSLQAVEIYGSDHSSISVVCNAYLACADMIIGIYLSSYLFYIHLIHVIFLNIIQTEEINPTWI